MPVAARSKAWVYGRSLAGVAGSNPTGGMEVCLLWMLCVVRWRSLRLADHLSRGVLSNMPRRCMWPRNLKNEEVMAYVGPQRHKKKSYTKSEADTSNSPRRRGDVIEEAQFEDAGRNRKKRSTFQHIYDSKRRWLSYALCFAKDHVMLKTYVIVRSPKLRNIRTHSDVWPLEKTACYWLITSPPNFDTQGTWASGILSHSLLLYTPTCSGPQLPSSSQTDVLLSYIHRNDWPRGLSLTPLDDLSLMLEPFHFMTGKFNKRRHIYYWS